MFRGLRWVINSRRLSFCLDGIHTESSIQKENGPIHRESGRFISLAPKEKLESVGILNCCDRQQRDKLFDRELCRDGSIVLTHIAEKPE